MKRLFRIFTMGIALSLSALFLICFAGCSATHEPSTEVDNSFYITDYEVTMSVREDRVIDTVEQITVIFTQYGKSGIIRDFDLTDNVRYTDLSATRDGNGLSVDAQYDVSDMLSFYLGEEGDYVSVNRPYVYEIRYTMTVPALREKARLPLDVLGFDWYTKIEKFSATIKLPGAPAEAKVYSGRAGETQNAENIVVRTEGSTLTLSGKDLAAHRGVTVDMRFGEGVLQAPPADLSLLWASLIVLGILAVLILIKTFPLRQPLITRTVNFTAPDEMDPLTMGKVIDGNVDSEDMGALVFWLASKGYLAIDLSEGEDDPRLVKKEPLPAEGIPEHVRLLYDGLFASRESVKISALTNSFYKTAAAMKASANIAAGELYTSKSQVLSTVLLVLSCLALCLFLWGYGVVTVGPFYQVLMPLIPIVIATAVAIGASSYAAKRIYKWPRWKRMGLLALACLVAAASAAILAFGFYPVSMSRFVAPILVVGAAVFGMICGYMPTRTASYSEKLGKILGYRDFIVYTERDKIAVMLKENPALYYEVLPYAQVLGVTDAWTDKFSGIDMKPPAYLYSNTGDVIFTAVLWNHTFHTLNTGMAKSFISRPTNSGGGHIGGGFGGGSFGGGGGGFGGGGGRSF